MDATKEVKTLVGWNGSKKNLGEYLNVGDPVDKELEMYFLEVLPPATWTSAVIQIGEPYDHDENNRPRFSTLEKCGENWVYMGNKTLPKYWGAELETTPGPWKWYKREGRELPGEFNALEREPMTGKPVLTWSHNEDDPKDVKIVVSEEDAQLIAVTPELLEMVILFCDDLDKLDKLPVLRAMARELITRAKATE